MDMKLIDGNQLETILANAIAMCTTVAEALECKDDPEIKMEIKAYSDILEGVKEMDEVRAIPIEWIRQQAVSYPGMESAMWDKLIRIWEGGQNE